MLGAIMEKQSVRGCLRGKALDVVLVGNVTRDRVRVGDGPTRSLVGGTVYYTGLALNALGMRVGVVTKSAPSDRVPLTEELSDQGVEVMWWPSVQTSCYEAYIPEDGRSPRQLWLPTTADSFRPEELPLDTVPWIHLGGLVHDDIPWNTVVAARKRTPVLSLDGQGLVRFREGCELRHVAVREEHRLSVVDVLKLDEREAMLLAGQPDLQKAGCALTARGPKEVLLTRSGEGSLVFHGSQTYEISSFPPDALVDPTGCGDTYMAGYIHQRFQGRSPRSGGVLGATLASLKLDRHGPLAAISDADRRLIETRMVDS